MSLFTAVCRFSLVLNLVFLVSDIADAQIKPDSTLGTESSTVSSNQTIKGVPSEFISGGAVRGSNLFHSFEKFNINSGQGAYFANPSGITNILTRITGNNPSNIFGVLGVLGNANLFLLNPNGIIFGPNARLNLNGSFLATTATSINLSDNTVFSATKPQSVPLLTISVPIGLSFTGNPGSIQVQGTGHNLIQPGSITAPIEPLDGSLPTGLEVQPGRTLALVGGDVNFIGGITSARSGRIEIGSVAFGAVKLNPNPLEGFSLDYSEVSNFQDVLFAQRSLLNASGIINGDIQIFGRNVQLTDSSLVLSENQGLNSLGTIKVNALDSLEITGITSPDQVLPNYTTYARGLNSHTYFGKGSDILISTKNLFLNDDGGIVLLTFGSGSGGNLSINAYDSVHITGTSPFTPSYPLASLVNTGTLGSGTAGNITLNTKYLHVENGGELESIVFRNGTGGDVRVNASESADLFGVKPFAPASSLPSIISSLTISSGNAGNLFINTKQLTILNGGRVDSSTFASGAAGSVTINAINFVNVSSTVKGEPSLITSIANSTDSTGQQLLQLNGELTGSSGDITINTNQLSVTNGAQVSVRNDGIGKAGTLKINANSINLDNQGGITASTASGTGGNIFLNIPGQLNLDHNSIISATAGGQGKGGNITIDPQQTIISNGSGIAVNSTGTGNAGQLKIFSNNLTLNNASFLSANTNGGEGGNISVSARDFRLERGSYIDASAIGGMKNGGNITLKTDTLETLDSSTIKANAFGGPGGNIQVNTQGLFRSPDSVISASSTYGVNGTVQFNTLVNNSTLGIAFLPIVAVDPIRLIAQGCPASVGPRASKFIVTGSGGLPPSPEDPKGDETVVEDWRTASTQSTQSAQSEPPTSTLKDPVDAEPYPAQITEATGFETNAKGEIVGLVAQAATYTPAIPWLKPTTCHSH